MNPIKIKFWGVRGSIPTPGPRTVRYGGNTSCVELRFPGVPPFIVDAGSGIRELGKELLRQDTPVKAYIFLSHFHWDHIQGLPFFKPAFQSGSHLIIHGCDEPDVELNNIISMQMDPIYFPITIEDMAADVEFKNMSEGIYSVEGIRIDAKFMHHPGYTLGYRFTYQDRSIVYICDNEPFNKDWEKPSVDPQHKASLKDRFESYVDDKEAGLVEFISGADLLIHDSQYFPEEYQKRVSWGHSPFTYSVDIAVKGRVKHLVLFHHDPDHDDEAVDRITWLSRQRLVDHGYKIPCEAAREGMEILLR